mmetsp:Transcript_17668/g.26476  ORF Transcript_17668/g.26476 Transcript_17668/m.26476 type:complete len:268 (+) Transcript_17668:1441-2244(+)
MEVIEIEKKKKERVGTYRTDGQGIRKSMLEEKKPVEAKKLNPNSAAARRRKAAEEGGGTASIPLTRQSSKILKPKTNKQTFQQTFNGDTSGFNTKKGQSAFSEKAGDPFQAGEELLQDAPSFFGSKDSGTDASSQDWGGDFSSENGSGFDNFCSSDDGSRSTGFRKSAATFLKTLNTPKDISATVPPFEADDLGQLNFTSFGVSDKNHDFQYEEGFEATYNDNLYSDATTSILADINEVGKDTDRSKKKKKGFKGLFGKGEKIKYEM